MTILEKVEHTFHPNPSELADFLIKAIMADLKKAKEKDTGSVDSLTVPEWVYDSLRHFDKRWVASDFAFSEGSFCLFGVRIWKAEKP